MMMMVVMMMKMEVMSVMGYSSGKTRTCLDVIYSIHLGLLTSPQSKHRDGRVCGADVGCAAWWRCLVSKR